MAARAGARPLLIAAPFYGRAALADRVLDSVLACAEEVIGLRGELLLLNDDPGNAPLETALGDWARRLAGQFPCRIESNAANLGFVRTCNLAIDEAIRRGMDLLLLNSDVVVSPGALTEMVRVSRLDSMIGFVNPRSNNATLATLPFQERYRDAAPDAAEAAWRSLAPRLPEMSYVPTAVGFCLLVRWHILAEFGGFDEIYGRGYNEENDLVMRAGRRGYRAALANHAFVWHEGSASFDSETSRASEARNRPILLRRYPEYRVLTQTYFGSAAQRAEVLLGALLPDDTGRVEVALDFSSFTPSHNGTMEAGRQLLALVMDRWSDRFSVSVLCSPATYAFHDYASLGAPRRDPYGPEVFAAIFRVGQPYDWGVVERLTLKAATFGVFMLDTISLDCTQLSSPRLEGLWAFTLEHADLVACTSAMTETQFGRRFRLPQDLLRVRSLHSLDLGDYAPCPRPGGFADGGEHIFVLGNHFWHKEVASTVKILTEAFPERRIVVISGAALKSAATDDGLYAPAGLGAWPNVAVLHAGEITDEDMGDLYRRASAVVFPSHYEGFGMPLLNALAAKRPVFIRPLPPFAEIEASLGGDPNIHLFETTAELARLLETPPVWTDEGASRGTPGDGVRAADDIGAAIDAMIAHTSYDCIVKRIRAIQVLQDYAGGGAPDRSGPSREALAARFIARKVELGLEQLFRAGPIYRAAQLFHQLRQALHRKARLRAAHARLSDAR